MMSILERIREKRCMIFVGGGVVVVVVKRGEFRGV